MPHLSFFFAVVCVFTPWAHVNSLALIPPSPEAAALQAALTRAVTSGAPEFTFPPGEFFFNDSPLTVTAASAISLGGASGGGTPTTLFFGPGFGILLANSTNVTLHDVVIDYFPLPYVFGAVLTANETRVTMQLDPASMTFSDLETRYPPHDTWPPVSGFASTTGDLVAEVCRWGHPPPATPLGGGAYSLGCHGGANLVAGDTIVAATRVGFTLALVWTANVVVRDVTLHAASYMAVVEFQGDGGNVYERLSIVPRNTTRVLASNADGFHSSGMRAGPRLVNVEIRNLLDDYFNVHNTFGILVDRGASWALVGDFQLFLGNVTEYGTQRTLSRVAPGEDLSFFPLNSFSYPALGTASVATIERVPDGVAVPLLAAAYKNASKYAKTTPCSACAPGLNSFSSAQLYNVTFSGAGLPSAATVGSLANADAISNTGARIEGCVFSGSASNLGRFKSSGGVIQGTVFRNTVSQNLEISPLQNWLEGSLGIHSITVADNVFYGTTVSPIHVFGATGVTERNNSFLPHLDITPT